MGNFIKLDFKKNRRLIKIFLSLELLMIALAIGFHLNIGFDKFFQNRNIVNIIFTAGLVFFVFINFIYIVSSLRRDFYERSAYLTFSLPISSKTYTLAKISSTILIYMINLIMILIFFQITGFDINSNIIYYFALGLIWTINFENLIRLIYQNERFKVGSLPVLKSIIIFLLILGLGFIVCRYFSFAIVNGEIQKAGYMNYAFIFPFAIGNLDLYKNLTPMVYYLLVAILLTIFTSRNLEKNLDL